jgi:predicted glycosyltransferase
MSKVKDNNTFLTSIEVAKNKVLIAPLNWGLGHATRCIPIIHFLIENNFSPVLASDGLALELLKKEFPELPTIAIPSYHIRYSKVAYLTKWKLMFSFGSIIKAVRKEQKIMDELIREYKFVGVISDNRFGIYHKNVPSIYMTHQLNVFSGFTTWFTSKVHQNMISKFDVCWVPDSKGKNSLSRKLSRVSDFKIPVKFIGNLSRLEPKKQKIKYDVLLLLSGPEPQRTILENILLNEFSSFKGVVLLVRGVFNASKLKNVSNAIEVVNYLTSKKLEVVINSSKMVVARSGYSTIMDVAKLNKKAFFIPTPGQGEQEYLANHLDQKKIAPFCKQEQFDLNMLSRIHMYSGFVENYQSELNPDLLRIFKKD